MKKYIRQCNQAAKKGCFKTLEFFLQKRKFNKIKKITRFYQTEDYKWDKESSTGEVIPPHPTAKMEKFMFEIVSYIDLYVCRPQGKVMFLQASVILSKIGLMATRSLLILVTERLVCILLECFLVLYLF